MENIVSKFVLGCFVLGIMKHTLRNNKAADAFIIFLSCPE
jgi:hypothetical protein